MYSKMEVSGKRKSHSDRKKSRLICDPCKLDSNDETAIFYCINCNEFLCGNCAGNHRKSKASRHHQLLDEDAMPTNKMASVNIKFCQLHASKSIRYFCDEHCMFCCSVCITIAHKDCAVQSLDGFTKSQEYQTLLINIRDAQENIVAESKLHKNNNDQLVKEVSQVRESIEGYRAEINAKLDMLQMELMDEIDENSTHELRLTQQRLTLLDTMHADLREQYSRLKTLEKYKQNRQLYIYAKEIQTKLMQYQDKLKGIPGVDRCHGNYMHMFKRNDTILQLLYSNGLGSLETKDGDREGKMERNIQTGDVKHKLDTPKTSGQTVKASSGGKGDTLENPKQGFSAKGEEQEQLIYARQAYVTELGAVSKAPNNDSMSVTKRLAEENQNQQTISKGALASEHQTDNSKPAKASYVKEINTKHESDQRLNKWMTQVCWITGITKMEDDMIAVTDHENSSVKVIDLTSDTIKTHCQLESEPYDLTSTASNDLIVTCDEELVFLQLENNVLSVKNRLPVESGCRGIASNRNKLYLTFAGEQPCVQELDMEGNAIRVFAVDKDGCNLFSDPRYLAVSVDGQTLYVSDRDLNVVKRLSLEGEVLSEYKHDQLKSPTSLVLNKAGNVFVAGMASCNIHQITRECLPMRILLGTEKSILWPQALLFDTSNSTLYMAKCTSNLMYVYKIE